MTRLRQGLAVPCFGDDPRALAELGLRAEEAGFDGFFVWDHVLFSNEGEGPDILDPWIVLAVTATLTSRIRIGPMITPISRRRPWILARQAMTLDRLSQGRLILGVGLGSPAYGDFAAFGDAADPKTRAEMLDEGLALLAQFLSGERFSHAGVHFHVDSMRFTPTPVQRQIPIWIGGVLPARRPLDRAARWHGSVPVTFAEGRVARPTIEELDDAVTHLKRHRPLHGFDVAVWSELAETDTEIERLPSVMSQYADIGATWWIETGRPGENWREIIETRISNGPIHT
jgi:alkanesulfonate monooxygenase SsuD/methylene tetrahydromethanopterin reductase-like flavin-dependent oxidoreductase (luciferase family)